MEDLSLKKGDNFTDFNERFYKRFPDLTVFDCDEINLVKVVLDGLKVNYVERGIKTKGFYSNFGLNLAFYLMKSIITRKKKFIPEHKRVLLFGSHRRLNDDSDKLVYFQKFLDHFQERAIYISQLEDISNLKLTYQNVKLLYSLLNFLKRIESQFSILDFQNIQAAFQGFYEQFITWDNILNKSEVRICFFTSHYHREGFIYALKKNNVRVIELQHGLISEKDIFYCFPKPILAVKENALFADKILLIGEHWDHILGKGFEYSRSQREIVSDFWEYPAKKSIGFLNEDDLVILVTSQTGIREFIFSYAKWLTNELNRKELKFKVIFKPHPAEIMISMDFYDQEIPENMLVSGEDVYSLLDAADIQISVYSTTLIEGHRFGVKNYSLFKVESLDYISEFIENGYSSLLEINQLPELKKKGNKFNSGNEKYFIPFQQDMLDSILNT